MLRYLRENTGNWIIKIFLGIIVIVFVFLGVGSMNASKRNEVAVVDDQAIGFKEFQDAYRNTIEQMRQQFGNALDEEMINALNLKEQAINSLINQKILDIAADNMKIMVTDSELQDALLGIKAFQKDGQFNLDMYKAVLARNRMTPESFEALQRHAIKNRKLQEMVLSGVVVNDDEAAAWYRFNNTTMSVDYVKFDPDTFTDIVADADQVKKEYQDHKDQYLSEPKRRVKYLVFSPEDYKGSSVVSDEQAQSYYQENIARFTTPEQVEASHVLIRVDENAPEDEVDKARAQADTVYEKAVKGEDFAELARTYSQGPSAPKGGYLGKFGRSSMVKPFGDAAFALSAGDISKPVRTQFGFHVIKVMSKTAETTRSFDTAKASIVKQLEDQELQNLAYDKAGEAFDAVIDGDDMEQVALVTKKNVVLSPAFSADGKGLSLDRPSEFARAAFALGNDQISEVKQIADKYYLIKVAETIDPKQLPLEDVEADIKLRLIQQLKTEAAKKAAQDLVDKCDKKNTLAQAVQDSDLTLETSKPFNRNQAVPEIAGSTDLVSAAFTLDSENRVYDKVVKAGPSFFVIGFKDRQIPDDEQVKSGLDTVKQEMISMKHQQYYTAWVKELRDKADVKINRDALR